MIFFTADEHYGHQSLTNPQRGIIQYCNRPFRTKDGLPDIKLMDETLIANHNRVVGPDDSIDPSEAKKQIDEVLKDLSFRERAVIILRFGLDGCPPLTLSEVGKKFKVTRERVRNIEALALAKLQHPCRAKKLEHLV